MRNRDRVGRLTAGRGSILSIGSSGSILSIGSAGSILSIGSAGSIGSVLSVGSAASVGSVLSALSCWSVLSWRGQAGKGLTWKGVRPSRRSPDNQDRAVGEVDHLVRGAAENEAG